MDIYEEIINGKYTPTLPTASVSSEEYYIQWAEYNRQCEALEAQFKKDALAFVGLTNHPKANETFKLVCEICADERDEDTAIVSRLQDFAQLILLDDSQQKENDFNILKAFQDQIIEYQTDIVALRHDLEMAENEIKILRKENEELTKEQETMIYIE